MELFIQILGWGGTGLVLIAYFLVSTKRMPVTSTAYQLMNVLGAVGLGTSLYVQHAWSALTLQIVWGIIALWSLAQIKLKTA